ncbi:MAG TPA: ATP-binding cassette domain-containing protein [Gaiellaceae bacterium]|nr:ATP-binding cassette domain-containing protein [Gaiellaceae bacterium]
MRTASGMLAAANITKSYGSELVLDGLSVIVPPRARIGVVGPNGSGKTTLLRVLAGLETPDSGLVERRPASLTVGYLPQDGVVPITDVPSWKLRKSATRLGLEVDPELPAEALSGGQFARAKLAALLAADHDVLLLDEPTNDLDFDGLALLERFVAETESALVIVSHDRAFLEHAVEHVVEFEAETRRVLEFAGSWGEYERVRALARDRHESVYAHYAGERDRFTALLHDRRTQARAGGKQANRRGTHALMSKVRSAKKRLERLERVEKPWEPWRLHFELRSQRAGQVVARLDGVVVERGDFRLGPVDLELRHGDRLAVTGPNGSGKTTLIGALLGDLPLRAGRRYLGPGVKLGKLEQQRSQFAGQVPLLETFCAVSGLPPADARTLLAKFALRGDAVFRSSWSLSPGERTRAGLALLSAQGVNTLLLDEPTNHLDLEAIEELETALEGYEGTIVLVTHDRRLLQRFEPTQTLELPA